MFMYPPVGRGVAAVLEDVVSPPAPSSFSSWRTSAIESATAALSRFTTVSFFCGVCACAEIGTASVIAQRKRNPRIVVLVFRFETRCGRPFGVCAIGVPATSVVALEANQMVRSGGARERARTVHAEVSVSDASSGFGALVEVTPSRDSASGSDEDSSPRAIHAAQSASLWA
jgi:hypothetical protein